jgi:hypothetical protein
MNLMKNSTLYLMIFFFLILITSCSSLKRYRTRAKDGKNDSLVTISMLRKSLSSRSPADQGKALWDLTADAQSQLIKILNVRYPDNSMFIRALNMKYLPGIIDTASDDYTNFNMRLVFSVGRVRDTLCRPEYFGVKITPADRIEYLCIKLTIPPIPGGSSLLFKNWNLYSTDYGSIDIGDVSSTVSGELTPKISQTLSTDVKDTEKSSGTTISASRKEDQKVSYRYMKLNGKLDDHSITMEEEGTREIDLSGNISADVALNFDKFPVTVTDISGLKDSTGRFNDPSKVFAGNHLIMVPKIDTVRDKIYGILDMYFIYRNVKCRAATFPEWDDRVKYYCGHTKQMVTLFTKEDYMPPFYCIGPDSEHLVGTTRIPGKPASHLIFRTYNDAREFYDWLKFTAGRKPSRISFVPSTSDSVKLGDRNVGPEDFSGKDQVKIRKYFGN